MLTPQVFVEFFTKMCPTSEVCKDFPQIQGSFPLKMVLGQGRRPENSPSEALWTFQLPRARSREVVQRETHLIIQDRERSPELLKI